MVDIQFEEGNITPTSRRFVKEDPYFVTLLLKTGLVKDAKQAGYLLAGFAILGILITLTIFWNLASSSVGPVEIPPEVLRQMRI